MWCPGAINVAFKRVFYLFKARAYFTDSEFTDCPAVSAAGPQRKFLPKFSFFSLSNTCSVSRFYHTPDAVESIQKQNPLAGSSSYDWKEEVKNRMLVVLINQITVTQSGARTGKAGQLFRSTSDIRSLPCSAYITLNKDNVDQLL